MSHRTFPILSALAIVGTTLSVVVASAQAQSATAGTAEGLRTPWGEPDLQGIWNNPSVIPLERDEALGTREFLTAEEIAAAEQELVQDAQAPGRDNRDGVGTEVDVARAYNEHWFATRRSPEVRAPRWS